jgi:DNA-binding MarR family transcriptional regulator
MAAEIARDAESFDPQEWPFFWITQVSGRYLQVLEPRLKRIGLDVSRWRVLMCVRPNSQISVSEVAELAIVKLPTMMKLVQRMESDGLVVLEPRPSDGRVTEVTLTPAGLEARRRAWAVAREIYDRVFSGFKEGEQEKLNLFLKRIFSLLVE